MDGGTGRLQSIGSQSQARPKQLNTDSYIKCLPCVRPSVDNEDKKEVSHTVYPQGATTLVKGAETYIDS